MVLDLQARLVAAGLFRAVGAMDTVVAAYALVNSVTVVHYDRDFEYLARVHDDFRHLWIAPSGSLDR